MADPRLDVARSRLDALRSAGKIDGAIADNDGDAIDYLESHPHLTIPETWGGWALEILRILDLRRPRPFTLLRICLLRGDDVRSVAVQLRNLSVLLAAELMLVLSAALSAQILIGTWPRNSQGQDTSLAELLRQTGFLFPWILVCSLLVGVVTGWRQWGRLRRLAANLQTETGTDR